MLNSTLIISPSHKYDCLNTISLVVSVTKFYCNNNNNCKCSILQESPHAIYGMFVGVTDSNTFLLTGGSDMRVRYWDLSYPANSFIMANAAGDPTQQTAVSYR